MSLLVIVGILGLIVLANSAAAVSQSDLSRLLLALLVVLNLSVLGMAALLFTLPVLAPTPNDALFPGFTPQLAQAFAGPLAGSALWGLLVLWPVMRRFLARFIPLNPDSPVHMVALVLAGLSLAQGESFRRAVVEATHQARAQQANAQSAVQTAAAAYFANPADPQYAKLRWWRSAFDLRGYAFREHLEFAAKPLLPGAALAIGQADVLPAVVRVRADQPGLMAQLKTDGGREYLPFYDNGGQSIQVQRRHDAHLSACKHVALQFLHRAEPPFGCV